MKLNSNIIKYFDRYHAEVCGIRVSGFNLHGAAQKNKYSDAGRIDNTRKGRGWLMAATEVATKMLEVN